MKRIEFDILLGKWMKTPEYKHYEELSCSALNHDNEIMQAAFNAVDTNSGHQLMQKLKSWV